MDEHKYKNAEGLAWQISVWDRMVPVYVREIDKRFQPIIERVVKLGFTHAIDALDLLLLAELLRVLGRLAATRGALSVLSRRVRPTLDGALLGETLRALEKELRSFAPTLSAARPNITAHDLHSPTLGWTAAVMRNRRHVLDGLDL